MRTTLDIDNDVLTAVKDLARAQNKSAGKVVSELVRQELTRSIDPVEFRNGVPVFPKANKVVTSEMVRRALEDDA